MNQNSKFSFLVLAALAGGLSVSAQKTIVMKQDSDRPQTVVESEKGYVIVNGDTVVRPGETSYRKIVIDREADAPAMVNKGGFGGSPGRAAAQKARLGVITDPEQSQGGAYVREVQPGSPAQAAGLKAGDKITLVDGSSIASAQELIEVISAHAPEDTVKIGYERAGKKRTATAYLEGAPNENPGMPGGGIFGMPGEGFGEELSRIFGGDLFGNQAPAAETPKIGISVEERLDGIGVETLDVASGSAAEKAGLRKGDLLTQLGDTKINSPQTLQSIIRRQQGTEVTLRYQRNGKAMTTKIAIPKKLKKMDM